MAHAWGRQWPQVQKALARAPDRFDPWRMVKGPAAATALTAVEVGWTMAGPWHLQPPMDGVIDIREVPPLEVLKRAEQAILGRRLSDCAWAKEDREPLRHRPFMLPVRQLLRARKTDIWTRHHFSCARTAALGGHPSQ
eukprot:9180286-Pyramimonas_sp.AAC.1